MTDDELLAGIHAARDLQTVSARIRDYYRDADRADRTPRELLYLHLGMLTGAVDKLLEERAGAQRRRVRSRRS